MTGYSPPQEPLTGLRVIDFGQYVAGPAAAMLLGDLGAEIIRVDPPSGPMWDSPAVSALNRGKKSITLDLDNVDDVEIARSLIDSADVVIENFRPGVMDRMGLGPGASRTRNPALVYLSLPGFSSLDPRRDTPGWEAVVLAATGGFTDMGLNRVLMGINPSYTPLPLASSYAAALGAVAVAVALFEREVSGIGDTVEVSLADAVLEGLAYNSLRVQDLPRRYLSLREVEIDTRRCESARMDMSYDELQELLDPFYRSYECADGRMFYNCCPAHRTHAITALKVLGLWDEVKNNIPLVDPYTDTESWPDGQDCTLLAYPLSQSWSTRLGNAMKRVFLSRSSYEWERLFDQASIPGAAHRTSSEWMHSDHAHSSGLMVEVDDPVYGRLLRPGPVVWVEGTAPSWPSSAPALDEHREEILRSLRSHRPRPLPPPSEDPEHRGGLPLDGIRVLDITNVIAGPTIGSTLARFGAEVIKIDPLTPTFDPYHNIVVGLQANRGKQSLLADLKTAPGQKILESLIAASNVVTFNGSITQMASLGLDPQRINTVNPDAVVVRVDAYGGLREGPRSHVPGYDDNVQACTGIMTRFGGSPNTPEEHAHLGTIDALAGFCATAAAVVALVQQRRTDTHHTTRVSLAAAGQLLQIPFMYDRPGRAPFDEPHGRNTLGEHALYRCYHAADGWLVLAGRIADAPLLARLPAFADVNFTAPDSELSEHLAAVLRRQPIDHWHQVIDGVGAFAIQRIEDVADLKTTNTVDESAGPVPLGERPLLFVRHDDHPCGRWVDIAAPNAIRFDRSTVRMPSPAPRYGEHTHQVLTSLGYSDSDISTLTDLGIVTDRWTPDRTYLPT